MTENEAIEILKIHRIFSYGSNAKVEAIDIAIKALEEIQQYREIGTADECREARNKQIPKKPEYKDVYPHGSNHLCVCGFIVRYRRDKNCPKCGQLLDWSDTD